MPPLHRHCMIVHSYYPVGETRVQRQALALLDAGIDVDVICLRGEGEPARETVEGVRVFRLPVRRHKGRGASVQLLEYLVFFFAAFFKLIRLLIADRYATVQVHNLPDFLVFAALPARLVGAKIILDLHDLMPELFAGRFETDLSDRRVKLIALQERLACRFADRVVTVTHEWRDTLVDRGVRAEKTAVVMNLADGRLFSPRVEGPGEGLHLLYHGTFTHRYGVDVAVEATEIVARSRPDVRLSLLGDGETRPELVALVDHLGLEARVTISPGMVEAEELPGFLATADIGLVPNRSNIFTDGILPTKLLEYVAMGIPVVVTRTPGVAAYFDESMVGFAQPGDAADLAARILDLASDSELRRSRLAAVESFNERYNWGRHAREYVAMVGGLRDGAT
ncbi:MAG: glycosyltransferase family 4 protein [Acidimicrobiia bacterium]|nr:glycosyltransferase family 4 protein [Acidimicrobiia bacterium]MDH4307681.1 glycosyltransferase family 4 protein [Acidimicrobiia bacterium]MDH5292310.1 glycosyltransferase family 4 protein [Acidimicrobiia bacterium]